MTSSKLAAVGTMIGILVLLWWFSSLSERLAQIEKTLSDMQADQQQWPITLAREQPLVELRTRLDLLESRLLSEIGESTAQVTSGTAGLVTQLAILESRIERLKDQLEMIEGLVEGSAIEQTARETATTGSQP